MNVGRATTSPSLRPGREHSSQQLDWLWAQGGLLTEVGCGGGFGGAESSPTLLASPRPQLSPGSEEDEAHEGCSRENLGRIQFSVGYNFQESTLTVKIMKAQELPAKDFSGTSDPFVKIYLMHRCTRECALSWPS